MASNLRDRGFPSAKEYRENKSDKRNTPYNSSTSEVTMPYRGSQYMGATQSSPHEDTLNKLVTAYNSRAFANPKAPLLSRMSADYVTDDTDERAYMSGLNLMNHAGNRLGFVSSNVTPQTTGYYAGIDNLPFGANPYSRQFSTPLGTIAADYDGDGTASLSFEGSPSNPYIYLAQILSQLR